MIQTMLMKYFGISPSEESLEHLALRFLRLSDWMITRELETGTPCPQEVKDARALARTQIGDV